MARVSTYTLWGDKGILGGASSNIRSNTLLVPDLLAPSQDHGIQGETDSLSSNGHYAALMASLWSMTGVMPTAMLSSHLRSTILLLSLFIATGVCAERGTLKADGIIRVKGADVHGATMTVVPGNAASYILSVDAERIILELPLDDVYLISVEREGCPTKEVYFDTRVPAEMHASEFDFPFQVTLQWSSPEHMFAYSTPVGFVRYEHALKDFSYDTQYVIRVEEELEQRMMQIHDTGVDPKTIMPILPARVVDRPKGAYSSSLGIPTPSTEGHPAPTVREIPRMVNVLSPARTATENPEPHRMEILRSAVPVHVAVPTAELPTRLPVHVVVEPISSAPRDVTGSRRINTENTASSSDVSVLPSAPRRTVNNASRSEELISEPRRVTRIIRLMTHAGTVHEYRMVKHAFGGVYYFQDSRSITERDFAQGVAE